ncbi:YBT1 [Symbiodinium sp. KB8]|nr:YBT1 [Symbiodinium sp. KB8]
MAILFSSPGLAPMAGLLALLMWRLAASYSPVAAECARMVSVLNGPVVAHLLECLEGREYLRTFGQQGKAVSHALWVLEASARAQILNMGLQRWFALQLELIGGAMLLCVSVMIVLQTDAHLGMSGLSLTYALTLTALAKYLVNYSTRASAQMASVERLLALSSLRSEEEVNNKARALLTYAVSSKVS